ncbi:MAG: amidohydrolase [Acidimicrobiia bacterium]|nr:amidohydrolase [Acidimicrobiia bacterium]
MALEKITDFEYPVIDVDLHIMEPPAVFSQYLDPQYRDRLDSALGGPSNNPLSGEESTSPLGAIAHGTEINTKSGYMTNRGVGYRAHLESAEAWAENAKDPDYFFPGSWDPKVRLELMDAEGIDKGIVRNTIMAGLCSVEDTEFVVAACRAYNDWIRDYCNADPDRLFPEALLPVGDMDEAIKELERTADMGFKGTVMPGSTAAPKGSLSDPYYDPLWARLQEMGWPLCIHATFNPALDSGAQFLLATGNKAANPVAGPAYIGMFLNLNFMFDNIVTLGEITLAGMCDKFPDLNIYFIEAGHSWVGEVLYRLDKLFHCPPTDFVPEIAHWAKTPPTEIFERQIFVPFEGGDQHYMSDMGMNALSKNLVWASDIPHWDADGPWEGVGALRALKVDSEAERAIMGKNAAKLLNVPYDKRVRTSKATATA